MMKRNLNMMTRSPLIRLSIFLLILCILAILSRRSPDSLLQTLRTARDRAQIPFRSGSSQAGGRQHPIQQLAEQAERQFDELLNRQSTTVEEAEQEYLRRYKRSPPPGFDAWFEYAIAQGSPIIDEYDVLDAAIAPLLERSGQEISDSVEAALESSENLWSCSIHSGALGLGCEDFGPDILRLFADERILSNIPDVNLLVNALDEPRVLLEQTPISRIRRRQEKLEWFDLSHKNVWEKLVKKPCHQSSDTNPQDELDSYAIPLVQNQTLALDLCQHPSYENRSGFFSSPASLKITRSPVPILSPAVISTMGDIPFPALAYNNDMYAYDENENIPWENKTHGLYWAGKNTGSFQSGEEWKEHHRQRFVSLANNLEGPKFYVYMEKNDGTEQWEAVEDEYLNTAAYNVHFTGLTQCDPEACTAQKKYFGLHVPDTRGEALQYTLTFDLDGNGHSGRYYRLLESTSLPLKQTVFREWHDERLQPWLHYVPISLEMQELPEVVRYFVEEEEGQELARELAEKGREWVGSALTPEEMVVYLYRVILEVARLQDVERRVISR